MMKKNNVFTKAAFCAVYTTCTQVNIVSPGILCTYTGCRVRDKRGQCFRGFGKRQLRGVQIDSSVAHTKDQRQITDGDVDVKEATINIDYAVTGYLVHTKLSLPTPHKIFRAR